MVDYPNPVIFNNFQDINSYNVNIYDNITSGTAFQNPRQTNIDNLRTELLALQTNVNAADPSSWTPTTDAGLVSDKVDEVITQLDLYETHTNRLSGVTYLTDIGTANPDVLQLMGVAQSVNMLDTSLSDFNSETVTNSSESFFALFGSLMDSVGDELDVMTSALTADIRNINLGLERTAAEINTDLDTNISTLAARISGDTTAYNNAINKLSIMSSAYSIEQALIYKIVVNSNAFDFVEDDDLVMDQGARVKIKFWDSDNKTLNVYPVSGTIAVNNTFTYGMLVGTVIQVLSSPQRHFMNNFIGKDTIL